MKKELLATFSMTTFLCLSAIAQAAPIHVVENGQLVGAKNVDVNGVLYDVQFAGGTCIDIYSGCDANSDFTFQTYGDASAAAQALMDTVIIDTDVGAFHSNPTLINGITRVDWSYYTVVPYSVSSTVQGSSVSWSWYNGATGEKYIAGQTVFTSTDTTVGGFSNWSVWSKSDTSLKLNTTTNGTQFTQNDALNITSQVTNATSQAEFIDLKFWIIFPDGSTFSLQRVSDSTIEASATLTIDILSYVVTGNEPKGTYTIGSRVIDAKTGTHLYFETDSFEIY